MSSQAALASALFYGLCSVSLNFLNKAVVSSYAFDHPLAIMVCQTVFTVVGLEALRIARLIPSTILPAYSWKEGRSFMLVSLVFATHSTVSLCALEGMNIPMYLVVKRCTPLVSLVFSVVILRKPMPSRYLTLSILMITVGCIVASVGDLDFDKTSYFFGGLAVLSQAGYLTLVQKTSQQHDKNTAPMSIIQMLHVNSYNTLPVFLLAFIALGDPWQVWQSPHLSDTNFLLTFSLLIVSGSLLVFSQFLCTSVCSALTTTLVGVVKSVLQTGIGFFAFGGVKFSTANMAGILMNMIGGCLYSYVRYIEGQQAKEASLARIA